MINDSHEYLAVQSNRLPGDGHLSRCIPWYVGRRRLSPAVIARERDERGRARKGERPSARR